MLYFNLYIHSMTQIYPLTWNLSHFHDTLKKNLSDFPKNNFGTVFIILILNGETHNV